MTPQSLRDLKLYDITVDNDNPVGKDPDKQLIASVLLRAVYDLLDKQEASKALAWFFFIGPSYEPDKLTFIQCCELIEHDPNSILMKVCELENWVFEQRQKGIYKKIDVAESILG